ncbi:MAG: ribosomal-processing cysteine protease Prp [Ruminococcaceae bacterium]|nr:ribosomal-processing cysteine protease Prp [Oscillospiraceae bacterium]
MIEAKLFHSKDGFCAFSLEGHSGYAEEGSDIVCAAVSAIAQYIIGAAEHMNLPCRYELEDGLITFSFSEETSTEQKRRMQDFLVPFEAALKELCKAYGEYLKISCLEV